MNSNNTKKTTSSRILAFILAIVILVTAVAVGIFVFRSNNSDDNVEGSHFKTIVGKFTEREVTDSQSAILAVQDIAASFGYSNAAEELTLMSENTVDNLSYYRLQQNYRGIPVYGSAFVVVSDDSGETQGLTGNAVDVDEKISLVPTVDQKVVQGSVNKYFGSLALCPELTDKHLTIYQDKDEGVSVLSYCFEIYVDNEPFSVIVDATTGEVINCNSLVYTNSAIPSNKEMLEKCVDVYNADGKQFCLFIVDVEEEEHLWDGKNVYNWKGELRFTNDGGNVVDLEDQVVDSSSWRTYWNLYLLEKTGKNTVKYNKLDKMDEANGVAGNNRANQLVTELAKSYGFFFNILQRNGYDGVDGEIVTAFDDALNDGDAYSKTVLDKTIIVIGTNKQISTDLVAHEYMHSVESSISNMEYSGESGAIKEGYSDLFGELVEDWAKNGSLDSDCDWEHGDRILKDPSKKKYPETYAEPGRWVPTDSEEDDGGVHTNSSKYWCFELLRDIRGMR